MLDNSVDEKNEKNKNIIFSTWITHPEMTISQSVI